MYNSKNTLYLISAISAIEKIKIYSDEFVSADDFLNSNNQMNFNGTITLLMAIAEETKKIDVKLLATQHQIQWQNIVDMRNVLAHNYRGIDPEIVFDVVKNELQKLKLAFIQILSNLPMEFVIEILETNQYKHLKHLFYS
jgi:uncharacterized protein with HEPN domain